jgi:hypothetical protein
MTQSMTQSTAQKAREHPIVTVITVIGSLAAIYAVVHSLAPDPVERPLAEQFLTHLLGGPSSRSAGLRLLLPSVQVDRCVPCSGYTGRLFQGASYLPLG